MRINGALENEITEKAKKVPALQRQGHKVIFPDVLRIKKALLEKYGV